MANVIISSAAGQKALSEALGWFDVRGFGAKGDGVTDDAAALQDAFDASIGSVLYIPPGIYLCSTDLDIPGDDTKIIGVRGEQYSGSQGLLMVLCCLI